MKTFLFITLTLSFLNLNAEEKSSLETQTEKSITKTLPHKRKDDTHFNEIKSEPIKTESISGTQTLSSNESSLNAAPDENLDTATIIEKNMLRYVQCKKINDLGRCTDYKEPDQALGLGSKYIAHGLFQSGEIDSPLLNMKNDLCGNLTSQGYRKVKSTTAEAKIGDIIVYDTTNPYTNVQIKLNDGWYSDFLNIRAFKHPVKCVLRKKQNPVR